MYLLVCKHFLGLANEWTGPRFCVQVCLQKEQENRVAMELQMSSLEEQLEKLASDLSAARADRDGLKVELKKRQTENEVIAMVF